MLINRKMQYANQEYRLEMEGQIVEPDQNAMIIHCITGKPLFASTDPHLAIHSDFGSENLVSCNKPLLHANVIQNIFQISVRK
jgi:hypothetical protein